MKRRTFLQRFSSIIAVLSAAEAEWLSLGNHYYQALAQSSLRKLALLVGINQYPQSPALTGCLTDVELQRELLIHRFGFSSSNILSLTDEKATGESIETAFTEHLIKQAKPGDVVVFHFSGYGSRVKEESHEAEENALVPYQESGGSEDSKNLDFLFEEKLLLMLRSLATERVIAVIDASYYAPSKLLPTGLGARALPESPESIVVTEELNIPKNGFNLDTSPRRSTLVLRATSNPKQVAREEQWSGFSAGLFTYALTQLLWEITPATTISTFLGKVATSIQQLGDQQQPDLLVSKDTQVAHTSIVESFLPDFSIGAEGFVKGVEEDGKIIQLWLGGLPPYVLDSYGTNSRFTLVTKQGLSASLVLKSRSGLTAKAQFANAETTISPEVGQLVQEQVRVLPRNIGLTVALDTGLERIERVDATSAFATYSRTSTVLAGEQPADYVFGKLPESKNRDLVATTSIVVAPSRYGLFSLGSELIPDTTGEAGEAVKVTVLRLGTKIPTLLASKLWRLTANEGTSRLSVRARLEIAGTSADRVVMQRETMRTEKRGSLIGQPEAPASLNQLIPTIPVGSQLQFRVENMSDRPLYTMLLGLNSYRTAIALYSWYKSTETDSSGNNSLLEDLVIAPQETQIIPKTTAASQWVVQGSKAVSEIQLIFSTAPFSHTLSALEAAKHPKSQQHRIQSLLNPLTVAQAVLQDLHDASKANAEASSTASDSYMLDVNHWASLSFVYQVV